MRYFNVSSGLRGCYMPDTSYVVEANTRHELKNILESEASYFKEAGFVGVNKKAIAHIAASAWRDEKAYLPYCLPLAPPHARDNYCSGIFISNATRKEYLEQEEY